MKAWIACGLNWWKNVYKLMKTRGQKQGNPQYYAQTHPVRWHITRSDNGWTGWGNDSVCSGSKGTFATSTFKRTKQYLLLFPWGCERSASLHTGALCSLRLWSGLKSLHIWGRGFVIGQFYPHHLRGRRNSIRSQKSVQPSFLLSLLVDNLDVGFLLLAFVSR